MNEQEFNKIAIEKLNQLREQRFEQEEKARIELLFMHNFKSALLQFMANAQDEHVCFQRNIITSEPCDYDMRQDMDDITISKIAIEGGYQYQSDQSQPDILIFKKI